MVSAYKTNGFFSIESLEFIERIRAIGHYCEVMGFYRQKTYMFSIDFIGN